MNFPKFHPRLLSPSMGTRNLPTHIGIGEEYIQTFFQDYNQEVGLNMFEDRGGGLQRKDSIKSDPSIMNVRPWGIKMITVSADEKVFNEYKRLFREFQRELDIFSDRVTTLVQNDMELEKEDIVNFIDEYQSQRELLRGNFTAMMAKVDQLTKKVMTNIREENQ